MFIREAGSKCFYSTYKELKPSNGFPFYLAQKGFYSTYKELKLKSVQLTHMKK